MTTLSKSTYLMGLQCPLILWCRYNAAEEIPPPDEGTQAIFQQGHEVGRLAQTLFPGGVEVDLSSGIPHTLAHTRQLLGERRIIYEGSVSAPHTYVRADILVPTEDGRWDLIEVKSATSVKLINLEDVAFQRRCFQGAGVELRSCAVVVLNREYVRQGEIEPSGLFRLEDVTAQTDPVALRVEEKVQRMLAVINGQRPEVLPGPHCSNPYACAMNCQAKLPEHNVTELYRMQAKNWSTLLQQGIIRIAEISGPLAPPQEIQRQAILSGRSHVDKDRLAAFLHSLEEPLAYLDFETLSVAIPPLDGLRPYQQVPFQFSLLVDGRASDFLADGGDPRPGFLEALRLSLPPRGTILAWNASFEKGRLRELAELYPEHREWIEDALPRVVDLMIPFRNFWVYHPAQHGSCSIKAVLPALTGQTYGDLEIHQGDAASRAYLQMVEGNLALAEKARLRKALLEYCRQDTAAMGRIVKVLESYL